MRVITEANAQLIIEVIEEQIKTLESLPKNSLRVLNRIRLMRIALMDLKKGKINKNQIKKPIK